MTLISALKAPSFSSHTWNESYLWKEEEERGEDVSLQSFGLNVVNFFLSLFWLLERRWVHLNCFGVTEFYRRGDLDVFHQGEMN